MIQCPVFHVNGDDVDAVARVVDIAMEYRSQFQSDVVIDMFCYRKFGHNEMDEPSFTQPVMYERIQNRPSVVTLYGDELIARGVVTAEEISELSKQQTTRLEAEPHRRAECRKTSSDRCECRRVEWIRGWSGGQRRRGEYPCVGDASAGGGREHHQYSRRLSSASQDPQAISGASCYGTGKRAG